MQSNIMRAVVVLVTVCLGACSLDRIATGGYSAEQVARRANMSQNELLDKTGWKTFCAGRYAADFPTQHQTYMNYKMLFFRNIPLTLLREVDTRKKFEATVQRYITMLNEEYRDPVTLKRPYGRDDGPRPDGKKNVIRTIAYPNGGVGIVAYDPRFTTENYKILYSVFVAEHPFRVYAMRDDKLFETNGEEVIAKHIAFAQQLRGREDHSVPQENGLCIDGGFIGGDTDHLEETIDMRIELPYYGYVQNKDYKVILVLGGGVIKKPEDYPPINDRDMRTISEVLRNRKMTVAGLEGYETAYIPAPTIMNKVSGYKQYWYYPGQSNSSQYAQHTVGMYVDNDYSFHRQPKPQPHYIQFSDAYEVLQVWDQVLATVRRLPVASP